MLTVTMLLVLAAFVVTIAAAMNDSTSLAKLPRPLG